MYKLDENGLTEEEFLAGYKPGDFPRPSVTADIVIFTVGDVPDDNFRKLPGKELRILLIQRGGHPFIGRWALPGGFVRPNETVGEAASRELEEETGIQGGHLEQLYTFSKPGRDPRSWVITCAHMSLIDSERLVLKAGTDAADARWFAVTAEDRPEGFHISLSNGGIHLSAFVRRTDDQTEGLAENNGLAFDHAEIIACAIQRLRSKLDNTHLAFSLLPEKFTLTELQHVHEAILGKQLFKAAFRRKIKEKGGVEETEEYTQSSGHRPSQLFTHRGERKD